jgi:4-amino-4-deoxy-L-arabinose transferase-like glycosyltransferase
VRCAFDAENAAEQGHDYNCRMRVILARPRVLLLTLLSIGLGVRLLGIAARPIWYDEAFSILFAQRGLAAMLQGTLEGVAGHAAEEHPLEYYVLLSSWMRIFGQSLPAVRALSVAAGIGVIGLVYLIGRELFTPQLGAVAVSLAALSPFQIHYAQEVRMYVFLCLWLLACTFTYLRGSRTRRWTWWVLFAIFSAAAQYTHSLAALYLIPLSMTPLFLRDCRTLRSVAWSGLLAILLYLPWLVHLPAQIAKVQQAYWTVRPGLEKLFTLLLLYTTNLPLPDAWLLPALFVALAIVAIALWQTLRAATRDRALAEPGLWLLYLAFAPPALAMVISQWQPIYVERLFLPSGAIFCLWAAWALYGTSLPRPIGILLTAFLATAAAAGIWQHLAYDGFPYAPYDRMGHAIIGEMRPGDAVIHSNKLSLLPSIYYNRGLTQGYIADPPGSSEDTLAPATRQVLELEAFPDLADATLNRDRVWFIIFETSVEEYIASGEATHPHIAWLNEHYRLDHAEDWGDLRVLLYTSRP